MLLVDHFGDFFVDEFVQRGRGSAVAVEVQIPAGSRPFQATSAS
jgi:hypothetical protein